MRAWRWVKRQLGTIDGPVIAYGESVGGTLAALLAERGFVAAAVVDSPVPNFLRWSPEPGYWRKLHMTRAKRRFLSPALHQSRRGILVYASPSDDIVPFAQNRRWTHRARKVRLRRYLGGHIGSGAVYERNLQEGFAWLSKNAP